MEDSKIIQDDDKFLVVKAVIASEIVHKYKDGMAYKPADELEKAVWTADGKWVKVYKSSRNRPYQKRKRNKRAHGKPLLPQRPQRPQNQQTLPTRHRSRYSIFQGPYRQRVLDKIRTGQLKDNSIGFSCDKDPTPGEFQGQKYDYVQRNICIDHLAAPIEQGRCPSPYCGINVDAADDDKPVVEVQDADLGISCRFDSAKYTSEKAKEWVQK